MSAKTPEQIRTYLIATLGAHISEADIDIDDLAGIIGDAWRFDQVDTYETGHADGKRNTRDNDPVFTADL